MRARAHIEPLAGQEAIIVTELPYQVKKGGDGGVIAKIADLVNDKKITEISDLRDESDRTGMRLQIELKRDAIPKVVLNKLYKHTPMQTTFGVNMVALVDGVPRTLSLLEMLTHYVDFQREVVTPRTKFELRQAEKRAHILEGYLIALDNLDAVIALIRGAPTPRARDRPDGDVRAVRSRRRRSSTCACAQLTALERDGSRTSTPTCRSASPSCARCSATRRRSTR
jgi:DNA gyrase subunit A